MNDSVQDPKPTAEPIERWLSAGGIAAALAATSCCVVPFALFAAGVSGAWIGNLTSLARYQPIFLGAAAGLIGAGLWRAYRRPVAVRCADGSWCARPAASLLVRVALWTGAGLVLLAAAFPYIAPHLFPL